MASAKTAAALQRMRLDPDIVAERRVAATPVAASVPPQRVPLNVVRQAHAANAATRRLVEDVGLAKLEAFTTRFYAKAFEDPKLDAFIRDHGEPHAKRFAAWIFEKLGGGNVWTAERRTRKMCPFSAHGQDFMSAHDRSSAHFAAWHSPKRAPSVWGEHFHLDDCRVWMRLHFWAAREVGLFADHPAFMDYYVRFIGHFVGPASHHTPSTRPAHFPAQVSVYERLAPPFARESARWSESPANVQAYLATKQMPDVVGVSPREALSQLPAAERAYTGSSAGRLLWPYA